jgi:KipI family sensor histidine kinase inhibitor
VGQRWGSGAVVNTADPAGPVFLPMGERAFLAEVETLDAMLALHGALAASPPAGVVELVPAARTVLVVVDPSRMSLSAAREWVSREARTARSALSAAEGEVVAVAVRYDGVDLADTAALLGLSPESLVARHRAARWSVAFTGFAPGFAYLVSPDWSFDVPRLAAPRTRVPAGAVGVAGGFTGAYPRSTPGGWRLVGTTEAVLFDPDSAAPVLLPPATRVRFTEVPS